MKQGDRLGKYEIDSVIGRGAMGVVYKAHDPNMDRPVAIKLLRADIVDAVERTAMVVRFAAEAKAYGRLLHPNIVTCYGCDDFDGQMAIVMEFVDGQSLKQMFDAKADFPPASAKQILRQLLDALAYSHNHGVIHRDIKPANLLMTSDGRLKVTDFGIARVDTTHVTQTGYVLGSPSYMSPEQFVGGKVDARSDLFSAAVLLYQLLTGRKPFPAVELGEALHQVMNMTPPLPSSVRPGINAALDAVVMRGLSKAPDERFPSAEVFAQALDRAFADERTLEQPFADVTRTVTVAPAAASVSAHGVSPPPRSRQPYYATIGGAAVVLAGIAVWSTNPSDETTSVVIQSPASAQLTAQATPVAAVTTIAPVSEAQVRDVLTPFFCNDLTVAVDGTQRVRLTGAIAAPATVATVTAAVEKIPGVNGVDAQLVALPRPYCDVMAVVQPFISEGKSVVREGVQSIPYKEGDPLVLDVVAPPFPAYMYVDYFTRDGSVVHLYPPAGESETQFSANARKRIGEPGGNRRHWEVSPPFGQEIITIIGAKQPLFSEPRSEAETASGYLEALNERMTSIGDDVTANYTVIVTEPR